MSSEFMFNRKEYAESYDKIRLTDRQKNFLMSNMQTAAGAKEKRTHTQSTLKLWVRTVAAVLTLVIFCGAFYFIVGTEGNSFTIVAGAAETDNSEVIIKSDLLAGTYAPSFFERKDTADCSYDEYGCDWFEHFSLSELSIKGENIDTVTFKANKNFTYFALFPIGENNKTYEEMQTPYKSKDFYEDVEKSYETIMPFTQSHYKEKSVEEEPYAAADCGKMCDGFVYKNQDKSDGEQTISLGNSMYFCLETDRTDATVDKYTGLMNECMIKHEENVRKRLEGRESGDEYALNEEETQALNQIEEYRRNLIEIMLDGATIDVTVKFNDGTQQTRVLELDYKDVQGDKLSVSVKASLE